MVQGTRATCMFNEPKIPSTTYPSLLDVIVELDLTKGGVWAVVKGRSIIRDRPCFEELQMRMNQMTRICCLSAFS